MSYLKYKKGLGSQKVSYLKPRIIKRFEQSNLDARFATPESTRTAPHSTEDLSIHSLNEDLEPLDYPDSNQLWG